MATHNRWMLQMLLENQGQWKAEQTLERERMAAKRDERAAECAECSERNTVGPRPNICNMADPVGLCRVAKELDRFLDTLRSDFNCHGHLHQQNVIRSGSYTQTSQTLR